MKKRLFVMVLALMLLLELFAVPALAATYTKDQIVEGALTLIYKNEGGYGSVNKDDNGAVSVGKFQWHGNRARNLLRKIINKDQEAALEILGEDLYNEILSSASWADRTVNADEAAKLKALLTTDNGKAVQDAQAKTDVTKYINHGMELGITDAAALIYFADLENQGGSGMSARVAKAAAKTAGSYGAITLEILHNAALADSVAGKYTSRRNKTYKYCLNYTDGTTEIEPSWTDYSKKPTTIYNTDALLSRTLSVSGTSINNVSEVGITIYNGTEKTVLVSKAEDPTPKDGVINMYYTVNDELNYTLTKNTQYVCQFHAIINGKPYYNKLTFVTGPNKGYTVSFNANGGSCSASSKTVPNGAVYGTLPTPTRSGYTFDGWYTAKSGGSKITSTSVASLSANQTLYAHWTSNTVTPTWSDCTSYPISIGNTDATLSRTLSVSGASINDVSQVGITLYDGTGKTALVSKTESPTPKNGVINMFYYVNKELKYTLTQNTQYVCQFQATINGKPYYSPTITFVTGPNHGYTVSFNANGGSCSASYKTVPNGAEYGTLPTPTRSNYKFDGWYTASSGGSKITSTTVATLSANQTLYAHWTHVCASGHTWNSGTVTKQPTATSTGVKTYTCSVCGTTKTETLPATGIETIAMHRLYNPNSGEHFYTGSIVERDNLVAAGWNYEGIAWYAPVSSGEPVYRAYNPNSGDHHYTMSWTEIQNLKKAGWNYEGVAWNSAPADQIPQYRLYNPNAICGSHHYTSSPVEKQNLLNLGWIYEGIGWYGYAK